MSLRTKRSTASTTSAADCAGAVPPARRAALRTARFERRTMPDIWIDPPNSGLRFGGSFCMRKQCACLRGGIGGGAVGRSGRGWTCGSVAGFCARFTPAVCSSVGAVCARCALAVCASLSVLCVRLSCRDAELGGGAMRFCCRVLSSVHACCLCVPVGLACSFAMSGRGAGLRGDAVLLSRFVLGSRLSFFLCQEKRDGLRCLAFLFRAGRDRH